MRALTLKQPWLYAVEHLGKRVENRSWTIPYDLRDQWIALHAGKSKDPAEWHIAETIWGSDIPRQLTFGAITSVAKFSHVVDFAAMNLSTPNSIRKWSFGPYVWMIDDLVLLDVPLACKGMLGLWTVPKRIEDKIGEQINLAPGKRQLEMQL